MLLLAVAEGGARLMGYRPWQPAPRSTVVEPDSGFFIQEDRLGYVMKPGTFTVTLNDSLTFRAQHTEARYRTCGPVAAQDTVERPQIWILGGSFTYGWGVNDAEAYPALIQQAFPEYEVHNFGVGGYGTLQSMYQLQDGLAAGQTPAAVVLAYASFHDQRNTCSRYWMKAIAPQAMLQGLAFPNARMDASGELVYGMEPVAYAPWPGMRISAFVHALEGMKCQADEQRMNSPEVSRRLILKMHRICAKKGIPFVLAGIEPDGGTVSMLERCAGDGVVMADISVDRGEAGMSLEPWDPHPSAAAHRIYAERLVSEFPSFLRRGPEGGLVTPR